MSRDREARLPEGWLGRWALLAIAFLLASVLWFVVLLRLPVLYDADSYYHLAVAQLYAAEGTVDALPWPRFSLLSSDFSDKEWLFHLLLVPFVSWFEPTVGGRLFLALLNGLLYVALARAAMRSWGPVGALLPVWLWISAFPFVLRAVRLRPEMLGLVLIVAAIRAAARQRWLLLGVLTGLYALAYTAFHALIGLCALWFLERWWRTRQPPWKLLLLPVAGAAVALVLHPHFPTNLRFWAVQNVAFFFVGVRELDVGLEIFPPGLREVFLLQAGWWLGLAALVALRPRDGEQPSRDRWAPAVISAAAFTVLFLLMARFSVYFVPLVTLAALHALRRRSEPPRPRRELAVAGALALCILAGWPLVAPSWSQLFADAEPIPTELDRRQWGREVPDGARVAAHWGEAEFYVFYAPQARYLNLLDPIFMALPEPERYDVQRRLFENRLADIPAALAGPLDSDWIAFDRASRPGLAGRLLVDPRIEPRYVGYHFLGRVRPRSNDSFLLDWTVVGSSGQTLAYPRLRSSGEEALPDPAEVEGMILEGRLPAGLEARCLRFEHALDETLPTRLEIGAMATLEADADVVVDVDGVGPALSPSPSVSLLPAGGAWRFEVAAGQHVLGVQVCAHDHTFYARRLP